MLLGNVIDELHDQNGFADAGAAEQTNLTALGIRCDQVNNLDARFKDLCRGFLLIISRRIAVNRPALHILRSRQVIHRITQKIEDAAEAFFAHRHSDRRSRIHGFDAAGKTVRTAHGNTADNVISDMLGNFDDQLLLSAANLNGVEQLRKIAVTKSDIQYRADNLHHGTDASFSHIVAPFKS